MQTQFLYFATGNTLQTFTFINILNEDGSLLLIQLHAVRNQRRSLVLPNNDRADITFTLYLAQTSHVVEDIDQVQAPQVILIQLGRYQEILIIQRSRFDELRPNAIHQFILDLLLDRTVAERDLLQHTLDTLTCLVRIEQDQTSGTCYTMVTGDNTDKGRGMTRQRLYVEGTVGEHGSTTEQGFLLRSVGVHGHHDTCIVMGQVRIFPTCVHHLTRVRNDRVPVGILVERQTTQALVLRVIQHHVTDGVITTHTGYTLIPHIRDGNHTSIGQISSIVKLQIGF